MANKILRMGTNLEFEEIEVTNRVVQYDELRDAVGNWIERVSFNRELYDNGIDVWCDEEYRLKDMTPSVVIVDDNLQMIDWLGGNLVFTARRGLDGESYSLTETQIERIKRVLSRTAHIDGTKVRLMKYK